ncbi:MAG: c-type cytochrome [Gammaproteobacteria bacterium]|nr:c-type cytochrome [Gammaproteobacteria bacterium]
MFNRLLLITLACGPLPSHAFDYFQPLPKQVPVPKDNPLSKAKIELGKKLFFDTRLSSGNSTSCNTCHNVNTGGTDGLAVSKGVNGQPTRRNTPALWNIGFQTVLFWDGRAKSLEDQFKQHVVDAHITGYTEANELLKRLQSIPGYAAEFKVVFGSDITLDRLAQAVASFERSLISPDSRYDRYLRGDKNALNAQELRGKETFRSVECLSCHFGVNFAGPAPGPALHMGDGFYELFPNHLGSSYDASHRIADDQGVFEFDHDPAHRRLWRVPPLRNIALTAPYFHNGSARTLADAVRIMAKVQLKQDLTDQQVADLVAFLNSLTGRVPKITPPHLPESNTTP